MCLLLQTFNSSVTYQHLVADNPDVRPPCSLNNQCCASEVLNKTQRLSQGERMQPVHASMHAPDGHILHQNEQMCRHRDTLKPELAACRPPSLWAICHMRMTL